MPSMQVMSALPLVLMSEFPVTYCRHGIIGGYKRPRTDLLCRDLLPDHNLSPRLSASAIWASHANVVVQKIIVKGAQACLR
jgi:hypothetical protein